MAARAEGPSRAEDLHYNGIHTQCKAAPWGARASDDTHRRCTKAGTVEQVHGHDFDGPLWDACGCVDWAVSP
ncbi:hypothetical protein AB0B94_30515 [Micromonospora sp. NPDC048986]|uniref:hypothetical protein n=1 Tax=Micromonospora sp. NPDC048986 TaxID=3155644 RepID=UPI0033CF8E0E